MLCKYFLWFIIFSIMGWIYESTFCTITNHKWQNRGFLHGPLVPIYGVGALAASILFEELPVAWLQNAGNLKIFLICMLGSMVLEYFTSWILEKLFHAYWWDYSNVPLNINGRICLPASIGFGVAGLLVVHVLYPFVAKITMHFTPFVTELMALLTMLCLGMDLALTVSALTDFMKRVNDFETEFNRQMTEAYERLEDNVLEHKEAFDEKREHLREEFIEQYTSRVSTAHKSTLMRIQGFRHHARGTGEKDIRHQIREALMKKVNVEKKRK